MGKHMKREPNDKIFEDNHPGCMWGLLQAIDYHHLQYNVKKMIPHKKPNGSIHAKGNGRPKARLDVHDSDEMEELLGAEASHFRTDHSTTKTSSTSKSSLKARIKALISQETSKQESCRRRRPGLPAQPQLRRTYSIHHLEPSDYTPREKISGRSHPFIFLHKGADSDRMKSAKKLVACDHRFNLGGTENVSDYLVHKQLAENQILFPGKCEKEKENSANEMHVEANQHCVNASCQCNKEYADVLEIFRVNKDLFLKIRQGTDDGLENCIHDLEACDARARLTKSGSFPAADLPRSRNFRPSKLKHKQNEVWTLPKRVEHAVGEHKEIDVSVNDLSKVKPNRIRRTASLDESLEKYTRFFRNSFSREAKLQTSKSVKLSNEYDIPSNGHAPIPFKWVYSLPRLDSHYSLQDSSKHVKSEIYGEQKPVNISASTEKCVPLEGNCDTECLYNIVERSEQRESVESINKNATDEILGLGEEIVKESNLDKEMEITLSEIGSNKLPQPRPVSVVESCSQDYITSTNDIPTAEGLECISSHVDEKESSVDSQDNSSSDGLSRSCSIENAEHFKSANKSMKNCRQVELCTINNPDFDYVSCILELSGFNGTSFLEPWHSPDQPLNPLVFEEVEAYWPHEPQCSEDETFASCHHQHLFDLINEVLLQIYDSSITYYPKALSFNCHIRPVPVKHHILEEVWARISRSLSSSQGVDQSVECILAQDLGKDDGWMNLQLETECVGLELEDIIFDELLEEIICSWDS